MPHRLTPAKQSQNAVFLDVLSRHANVRLAAQQAQVSYRTMQRRRASHAAFATQWNAALSVAHARLAAPPDTIAEDEPATAARTRGGELMVKPRLGGGLQVRRAQAGRLTRVAEQQFLAALSATCNVRLAAAAAGTQTTHFYHRRRHDPGFAREWRLALEQGYATLEAALIEGFTLDAHVGDAWRHTDPPALPPMTTAQALQLMFLHQKEARLLAEPAHLKRRRGEPDTAYSQRLHEMYQEGLRRDREAYDIAQAERRAEAEARRNPQPRPPRAAVTLPDLAQVTGWSKADPTKKPHGPAALFGGWRVEDIPEHKRVR